MNLIVIGISSIIWSSSSLLSSSLELCCITLGGHGYFIFGFLVSCRWFAHFSSKVSSVVALQCRNFFCIFLLVSYNDLRFRLLPMQPRRNILLSSWSSLFIFSLWAWLKNIKRQSTTGLMNGLYVLVMVYGLIAPRNFPRIVHNKFALLRIFFLISVVSIVKFIVRSKKTPKYLTAVTCGIWRLLRDMCIGIFWCVQGGLWKMITWDLLGLSVIFCSRVHCQKIAIVGSLEFIPFMMFVSSLNMASCVDSSFLNPY